MKSHPSLFLIFYFLFLINLSSWVSAALCTAHQSALLLKLKQGFSFQSDSKRLSTWIPGSSDCCSWEGLTCDNSTGLVIGLDLSTGPSQIDDWISGEIDSSLFQLHSLQTLDLSGNNFYLSPIPSGLGNLTRLTHLNLAGAGFSGQIPLEISRLTRLLSLDLSQNGLNAENPNLKTLLHNLTALQELHLDYVEISGDGNYEWSKAISSSLHNLRVLSLVDCSLSGAIDESLLRLPFLTQLLLDGNLNLSSLNTESFSDYTSIKLRNFSLSRCGLSGQFPENIFLLPNLITLDISMNNLTGSFPSFFPTNSSLEFLYLHVNMLNGTLPESMGNLKSLKILNLDMCNFWGPIPSSLKDLTQLDTLDLANNNFNGQIPPLSSPSIVGIDLSHNHLTGAIPSSLLALPSLQTLDLSHNQLMGSIPSSMVHLPSLQTLDLSHNQLMGSIPSSITDLIQLIELDLS